MRWPAAAVGLFGTLSAAFYGLQSHTSTTIVLTGDYAGHLQPCGCTFPQSGGITRQAGLVRLLQKSSNVVLLSNGSLTDGGLQGSNPKQDAYKVDAIAGAFAALNIAAVNLSPEDARLGLGPLLSIQNQTGQKLLCANLAPSASLPIDGTKEVDNLLIAGISAHPENIAPRLGTTPLDTQDTIRRILADAKDKDLVPILLLDGNEAEATTLATQFPDLPLIAYRSPSDPPSKPLKVGKTLLVSPGELGKNIVRLDFDGQSFSQYQAVNLGPAYADDPQVARFYKSYLSRVDTAGFLDQIPRGPSDPFAGTPTCGKCHTKDLQIWQHSAHSHALADLEKTTQSRDPDCVSCHVIGLTSKSGFVSRKVTPNLADVGCESCHGAGALHAKAPRSIKMKRVQQSECARCHTPEQSHNYTFLTYWSKIQHR